MSAEKELGGQAGRSSMTYPEMWLMNRNAKILFKETLNKGVLKVVVEKEGSTDHALSLYYGTSLDEGQKAHVTDIVAGTVTLPNRKDVFSRKQLKRIKIIDSAIERADRAPQQKENQNKEVLPETTQDLINIIKSINWEKKDSLRQASDIETFIADPTLLTPYYLGVLEENGVNGARYENGKINRYVLPISIDGTQQNDLHIFRSGKIEVRHEIANDYFAGYQMLSSMRTLASNTVPEHEKIITKYVQQAFARFPKLEGAA